MIRDNKTEKYMLLMNSRPYKTIKYVDIADQPMKNSLIAYELILHIYIHTL